MSALTRHSSRQRGTKNGLSAEGLTSYTNRPRNRHRYCGKEKDSESGLYYYGARYYESWTCRFVSVDPLAEKYAQLSSYNYADNSPVTDLDVDGLQSTRSGNSEQSSKGDQTGQSGSATQKSGVSTEKVNAVDKSNLAPVLTDVVDVVADISYPKIEPKSTIPTFESNISNLSKATSLQTTVINVSKNIATTSSLRQTSTVTPNNSKNLSRAKTAIQYATRHDGLKYLQENDISLRKGNTEAALSAMDCSEFVGRICEMNKDIVRYGGRSVMVLLKQLTDAGFKKYDKPQVGDVAVWYNPSNHRGHIGVVGSVDPSNSNLIRLVHESNPSRGLVYNKAYTFTHKYNPNPFVGYYRSTTKSNTSGQ